MIRSHRELVKDKIMKTKEKDENGEILRVKLPLCQKEKALFKF